MDWNGRGKTGLQVKFGEGGIRTLDALLGACSLSRGVPSTTRPPLHKLPKADNSEFERLRQAYLNKVIVF